jgi:hypothetical protein
MNHRKANGFALIAVRTRRKQKLLNPKNRNVPTWNFVVLVCKEGIFFVVIPAFRLFMLTVWIHHLKNFRLRMKIGRVRVVWLRNLKRSPKSSLHGVGSKCLNIYTNN